MNTKKGVASENGVRLHYECFGVASDPTVLFVCGMAVQSIYWPVEICHAIADAGYYLVRFDNRDTGPSTYTKESPKGVIRNILRSKLGLRRKIVADARYDLYDLVLDAIGVLNHLGIAAAHWVGFSMGGMISQIAAADHGERVLSLTSIMSSTNDSDLPMPEWKAMKSLFPRGNPELKSNAKISALITSALDSMSGTTHSVPVELKLEYAHRSMERGMNPDGPPAWVLPKGNRSFSALEIQAFKNSSVFRNAYRNRVYWRSELLFHAFRDPNSWMNRYAQKRGREHIRKYIEDPVLREALTPDYPVGCKRALLSDKFYPALAKKHVNLVTTGIERITEGGIADKKGHRYDLDAIVFGTGFRAQDPLAGLSHRGREGVSLTSHWQENGYQSYLGITTHGFPNLFTMTGPNTGLGHNSSVYMIEAQADYIASALQHLSRTGGTKY